MGRLIFLTHPQVVVDAAIPVTQWHLSQGGRDALQYFLFENLLPVPNVIWSSEETKALETAAILSKHFNCALHVHPALGENDRSATGFLPVAEFERVADQFFAYPDVSICGWETAVDAQSRIVAAVSDILRNATRSGNEIILLAGHGATGTLLYCALAGLPISRQYDQPSQGHYWCYDYTAQQMLHGWCSIG